MANPTIHCLYASTSGNVESVVERVATGLRGSGWEVALHRTEQTKPDLIRDNSHFILATSTWARGSLNPFFIPLIDEMKKLDLTGKVTGLIGLGDIRYENVFFNTGIDQLREVWEQQHGTVLFRPLKLNGDPYGQMNLVDTWTQQFLPYLSGQGEARG